MGKTSSERKDERSEEREAEKKRAESLVPP
jgi:hypothetical protein